MAISYGEVMAVTGESSIFGTYIRRFDRLVPFFAGNMGGGTGRKSGNSYWDGHYYTYARDTDGNRQPARFPNDQLTLAASFDSGTKLMTGTARCKLLEIEWPIESGGYVIHKVGFVCDGALSTGGASATDSTLACPMSVEGQSLSLDGATVANVNYMKLVIASMTCPYVDSTSAGQWRHAAANLDITAQWRVNSDDPADWPTIGYAHLVKMYVTATKFWELKWMRIEGVQPIYQERRDPTEPARPTAATMTAKMNASDCTALGYIKNPAATAVWNS